MRPVRTKTGCVSTPPQSSILLPLIPESEWGKVVPCIHRRAFRCDESKALAGHLATQELHPIR